jgi:uncharacterized protein YkvS
MKCVLVAFKIHYSMHLSRIFCAALNKLQESRTVNLNEVFRKILFQDGGHGRVVNFEVLEFLYNFIA